MAQPDIRVIDLPLTKPLLASLVKMLDAFQMKASLFDLPVKSWPSFWLGYIESIIRSEGLTLDDIRGYDDD